MPSLSNSYQPLSVRAGSTCFTFVYVNVIDLFWSLSSVRCVAFSQFSPDCLRFISPGGFGSGDHSQAFLPYSLPAWHCATLIKTAHPPPTEMLTIFFCAFWMKECASLFVLVHVWCLLATLGRSVMMKMIINVTAWAGFGSTSMSYANFNSYLFRNES